MNQGVENRVANISHWDLIKRKSSPFLVVFIITAANQKNFRLTEHERVENMTGPSEKWPPTS